MAIGKKEIKKIIEELEKARKCATYQDANFDGFKTTVTIKNGEYTNFIKKQVELYMGSWVISPIDNVLDLLKK